MKKHINLMKYMFFLFLIQTDKVFASYKGNHWEISHVQKLHLSLSVKLISSFLGIYNILSKIKACFDPKYGFSVDIKEINSNFTLCDITKCYQKILAF